MSIRYNYSDIDTICSTMLNMGTNDNNTVSSLKQKINTTVNETEGYQSQTFEKAKSYANRAVLPILDAFSEASSKVGTISNSIRQDYQDLCNNENLDLEELEKERSNNIFMLKEQIKDITKLSTKYPELKEEHLASICDVQEKICDLDSYYDQKIENLQLFDAKCGLYQQEVTTLYDDVEEKISLSNAYIREVTTYDTLKTIAGIDKIAGIDTITVLMDYLKELSIVKQLNNWWNQIDTFFNNALSDGWKFISEIAEKCARYIGLMDIISNFSNVRNGEDFIEELLASAYDWFVDKLLDKILTGTMISGLLTALGVTAPAWVVVGTTILISFIVELFLTEFKFNGKSIKQHIIDFFTNIFSNNSGVIGQWIGVGIYE